jgi:hypothetical protein
MIGSTLISTDQGDIAISVIAGAPQDYKVLSYDLFNDLYIWQDIVNVSSINAPESCTTYFVSNKELSCDSTMQVFVPGQGFHSLDDLSTLTKVLTFDGFDLIRSEVDNLSAVDIYTIELGPNVKNCYANSYLVSTL